ncbi:MAG: patatin-like phospholipase family protein [Deltaproteobacteria bacterium]
MAGKIRKNNLLRSGKRPFESLHPQPAIPFSPNGNSRESGQRNDLGNFLQKLLITLIFLVYLPSCAVDINTRRHHAIGFSVPDLQAMAEENTRALAWYKDNEWQFNKGDKTRPPENCLCLSGGGIRSAAFSIGVLKGLQEKGLLDKIDIISAGSGGSYALSWYYLQQYGQDRNARRELFDGPHLDKLAAGSKMYPFSKIASSALGYAAFLPLNLLFNQILSLNADTTILRSMYEDSVRSTFHSGRDASFPELRELIKKNGLPYFIINTSATIDYSPSNYGSKLANRVFEFTPLHFGSDGFGYSDEFPVTVGRAVSISGAAVDLASTIPGRLESALASSLNIDLGYHIDNYNNKSAFRQVKRFIPFYFLANSNDRKGTDICLTDAGHSENLGMYSLVRRLPRRIIVVDATFDPTYEFESYFNLKNALKSEMQVDLKVTGIDTVPDRCTDRKSRQGCHGSGEDSSFDTSRPVLRGAVSYFPIKLPDNTIEQRSIEVVYIKLSINDELFNAFPTQDPLGDDYRTAREYYGKDLVEYYLKTRTQDRCGNSLFGCEFPHHTTWDQNYEPDQFKAYVDLGYHIVRNEVENEWSPSTRCEIQLGVSPYDFLLAASKGR